MEKLIEQRSLFEKALFVALKMPGVIVNRNQYLYDQLSKRLSYDKLHEIVKDPEEIRKIDLKLRYSLAKSSIKFQALKVTSISFGLGLPGFIYTPGTIPADLAQYYFHVIVIIQKLIYLMGWPDLEIDHEHLDDESMSRLMVFMGAMFGSYAAETAIKSLSKALAGQVVKKLPKVALTKYGFYNLTKEILKWIGVKVTKEGFAKGVAKAVPIVGGFVGGGVTLLTFIPMSTKFLKYLSRLEIATIEGQGV